MPTLIDRHLKIPKYLQLAEHLRREIDTGRFQPDDRLPSLNDLKVQFGANQHTVERAHTLLENDGLIRREPGRGVFVNSPAPRKMTGNVGFMTPYNNMHPEEGNVPYWGSVLAGMRRAARDHDYHLLLIDNGNDFERWDKIDGAVLFKTHVPQPPVPVMPKLPHDFPAVSIFGEIPGMPCVTSDDFDGVYQLTRRLIQLGHRRIAYLVKVYPGFSLLEQRKAGYIRALLEAGIEPDARYMREWRGHIKYDELPSWYQDAGEYSMRCWLEEDWAELGCTALIAHNDEIAKGAIRAFEAAGLQVPRDVSVVGFDGLPAESGAPLLTTIEAPLQEIGRQALELLLDWLKNPAQTPQNTYLPIRFIEGKTTAPPSGVVSTHALVTA